MNIDLIQIDDIPAWGNIKQVNHTGTPGVVSIAGDIDVIQPEIDVRRAVMDPQYATGNLISAGGEIRQCQVLNGEGD